MKRPEHVLTQCRVCGGRELVLFFDLGEQPLANSLLDTSTQSEEVYPLALVRCGSCALVQLDYTVPAEKLFTHYVWVTGTSSTARTYAETFCSRVLELVGTVDGYVLELASNDGTFLKPFMSQGVAVLGIDPAKNIADLANKDGVPTEAVFWTAKEAAELAAKRGKAQVIFARNVLPHVADQRDFIKGAFEALREDGTLIIEAHDAGIILNELHYDSIYHEHMCYFTFSTLERLLNDAGFYVFDLDESPISGGSMVVYARKSQGTEHERVAGKRTQEADNQTNSEARWQEFAAKAKQHRDIFLDLLRQSHVSDKKVIGYGASARSSTFLNFCNVKADLLPTIADKNPLKQGKFTAGTHIPIKSPEDALKDKPTTVVLLGWNFAEEIKSYLTKDFKYQGNYLVPFPGMPHLE